MERLTKEEAIRYLTKQRDMAQDIQAGAFRHNNLLEQFRTILLETGETIGYTPAFRCLVKGLEPEQSIRWKE